MTTERVSIITADQVPALLEQILALRNPELATTRKKNHRQQTARYRRTGDAYVRPTIKVSSYEEASAATMSFIMTTGQSKEPRPIGANIIAETRTIKGNVTDLNRDLSPVRVRTYLRAMQENKWLLTSDAIAITADGLVINGQHRLAAALEYMEWLTKELSRLNRNLTELKHLPKFLILWNADRRASLIMDEAARPAPDRREIAMRYTTMAPPT